jgi:hypothetical protein
MCSLLHVGMVVGVLGVVGGAGVDAGAAAAVVGRTLAGRGAHRTLSTTFFLPLPHTETLPQKNGGGGEECRVLLLEHLPASMFVDLAQTGPPPGTEILVRCCRSFVGNRLARGMMEEEQACCGEQNASTTIIPLGWLPFLIGYWHVSLRHAGSHHTEHATAQGC